MHIIPSYLLLSACFINFYYLFKNFCHFLVHQLHSVLFCLPISLGFYDHNFIMVKNSKPIISFSFGYVHILTTATNEFSSSMATFGLPECYKRKLIWIWIQGNWNLISREFESAACGDSTLPSNPGIFPSPVFFLLFAPFVRDLHCPQTCIFCTCVHILL